MGSLIALLVGLTFGWVFFRRYPNNPPTSVGQVRHQLLRWIEDSPEDWLVVDPADCVQLSNPQAERLLQVDRSGVMPRQPAPLQELCPAQELSGLIQNARREQPRQCWQWKLANQDLEAYALPVEGEWIAITLHRGRSLEAQLEQQQRWVSDVAHELKTPLIALLLVGDSLAGSVNSRSAVLMKRLHRELQRLQALVGDLLELIRLDNTLLDQESPHEEVDLGSFMKQVWEGLLTQNEKRVIGLELDAVEGLPILGERSCLHRALLNLLNNALRFSPEGGTVRVTVQRNESWCMVSVRDEGTGLKEEDLERLFERFYRGDSSEARNRGGGSGLGLSIVQQIATSHGGRVQASNHPEGEAWVEMALPVGNSATTSSGSGQ